MIFNSFEKKYDPLFLGFSFGILNGTLFVLYNENLASIALLCTLCSVTVFCLTIVFWFDSRSGVTVESKGLYLLNFFDSNKKEIFYFVLGFSMLLLQIIIVYVIIKSITRHNLELAKALNSALLELKLQAQILDSLAEKKKVQPSYIWMI